MAVTIDIAQAGPLQAAIQKKLAEYGYSSDEDDTVMAEYVTVMLANSKSSAQITAELSDLIGAEYDAGFTDWIFSTAIPEHYTKTNGGSNGAQAQETQSATSPDIPTGPASPSRRQSIPAEDNEQRGNQSSSNIQTVNDSRDLNSSRGSRGRGFQDGGLPNRPQGGFRNGPGGANGPRGGGGVFGNAMSGVKREGDALDRPNRRPRMSGEHQNGGDHGGRSIFDRAGVRAGNFPPANGGGGGFGGPHQGGFAPPQMMQQQAFPQIPGLPPLHIPDNFSSLPFAQQQAIQQQIFQHQLIAAAAAQQMYMPPGGSPPPVQQQQLGAFAAPQPQQQVVQPITAPRKPVKLPPRPTSEELCKYGVDCKNAICRYSHPSPAASKESGLVLSKEVCDKGLQCEDKDCPRSHVSPAQKTDPEGLNVEQYKQKAAVSAQPVVAVAPVAAAAPPAGAIQAANPGAKPCMFGSACTRAGCFFSHPQAAPAGNGVPCKFGLACTRADCYFSHPPGQRRISTKPPNKAATVHQKNTSATFSPSSSTSKKDGLEGKEDVNIDDSKMSARMKRFMEQGGERERILPGSGNTDQSKDEQKAAGDAEDAKDEVEVVV